MNFNINHYIPSSHTLGNSLYDSQFKVYSAKDSAPILSHLNDDSPATQGLAHSPDGTINVEVVSPWLP